jgi:Spy/CpxP family protein refolding chaperone
MTHKWFRFLAVPMMAGGMFLAAGQTATQPAGRPNRGERIANYLNLTDAQRAQAKAEFQATRASTQPARQQLKQVRQQMFQAMQANDTARIAQLSSQAGAIKGQLLAARTSTMAKLYASLTPEQKAKADQLPAHLQQMRQRGIQRHQAGNNG